MLLFFVIIGWRVCRGFLVRRRVGLRLLLLLVWVCAGGMLCRSSRVVSCCECRGCSGDVCPVCELVWYLFGSYRGG